MTKRYKKSSQKTKNLRKAKLLKKSKSNTKKPLKLIFGGAAGINALIKDSVDNSTKSIKNIENDINELAKSIEDAVDTGSKLEKATSTNNIDEKKVGSLDKEMSVELDVIKEKSTDLLKSVSSILSNKSDISDLDIKKILKNTEPNEFLGIIDNLEEKVRDVYEERIVLLKKIYDKINVVKIDNIDNIETIKENLKNTELELKETVKEINEIKKIIDNTKITTSVTVQMIESERPTPTFIKIVKWLAVLSGSLSAGNFLLKVLFIAAEHSATLSYYLAPYAHTIIPTLLFSPYGIVLLSITTICSLTLRIYTVASKIRNQIKPRIQLIKNN